MNILNDLNRDRFQSKTKSFQKRKDYFIIETAYFELQNSFCCDTEIVG